MLRCDKSILRRLQHLKNIDPKSSAFLVFHPSRLIKFKSVQPLNMLLKSLTFDTSKWLKSMVNTSSQFINILLIVLTSEVSKFGLKSSSRIAP